MDRSATEYKEQMQALLPPGLLWDSLRAPGSLADELLAALAEEFARIDGRAADVLDEADPRTTIELLEEWETWAGLPDICTGTLDTLQERRAALLQHLTSVGGQSRAYFIEVAARLGYTVTITEYSARQYGDPLGESYGDWEWNFVWQVNAPATTIINRQHGVSGMGEPYRTWGNTRMECAISKLKPAHTHVIFSYGG